MEKSDFLTAAGAGYMLVKGKRFETAEDFLEYLYDQDQETREEIANGCTEDEKFWTWLRGQGISAEVRKVQDGLKQEKRISVRYAEFLCLLEQAAPAKKRRILNLCSQFLKGQPEYWLIQHLDLYLPVSQAGKELLEQKEGFLTGTGNGAEDFKDLVGRMELWMNRIREHMLNNYVLYERGFFRRTDYDLLGCHIDGYFVDDGSGRMVPVGYLKEKKKIQVKHCLENGVRAQIEEAGETVAAFRGRISSGIKQLETLQTEIRTSYKRPGRIRSVIGMAAGILAAWNGIMIWKDGLLTGTAGKVGTMLLIAVALLTFASGLRGFLRCGRWKKLSAAIREMKNLDGQAAALEEYLGTEFPLWEQKGTLAVRPAFPLEKDGILLKQAESLEPGLRKKASPLLWTLFLTVVWITAASFAYAAMTAVPETEERELRIADSEQVNWEELEQVSVQAEASSSLVSQKTGAVFGPERMLDGDAGTSWQEGADGLGEGETLSFSFYGETVPLKVISFYGGSFQSEEKFRENGRPAALTVIFRLGGEEKERFTVELEDAMKPNYHELNQAVSCDSLDIQINAVYPGSRYEDTAVTEMAFYKSK